MPLTGEKKKEYQREYMRRRRSEQRASIPVATAPMSVCTDVADDICRWAESTLVVPTGLLAGRPFVIEEWQRNFLRDALRDGVREAALCTPRKQGKSGLIAALCLYYLAGPGNVANWRAIIVSLTGALAKELRKQIGEISEASGLVGVHSYNSPTPGRVVGLNGASLDCLAADKSSGHAVGVDLALCDESGLLDQSKRQLWDAVYSSVSTRNGRVLYISIRGASPMYEELRERHGQPGIVWHEYAADPDCDLLDREQWHKANPGLGRIKSLTYMEDASRRAVESPLAASGFRSLDLNLPGIPNQPMILDIADYQRAVVDALPVREGYCVVALDVGGATAFTAACAYWPTSGRCELYAGIGSIPDVASRGQADGVQDRYQRMHQRGELWVYPDVRVTPLVAFLADVAERLADAEVTTLLADDYRQAAVKDALPDTWANLNLVIRRAVWKEATEDVTAFQGAVIGGKVAFPESLALASAIQESRLAYDAMGNTRLEKQRANGRIDLLSAAVLAVAEGVRNPPQVRRKGRYLGLLT